MFPMVFAVGVLTRIIFHNRNIQAPFNAALTAEGLHQGGLGNGISCLYEEFHKQYTTLDLDALADKGDATGVFSVIIDKGDGTSQTIGGIPCFFGLKNWYHNLWMMMHGTIIQATANKTFDVFVLRKWTKDSVNTSDTKGLVKVGSIPAADTAAWLYPKRMNLDNMIMFPLEFGGSTSTFYADGFYHPAISSGLRGLAAFAHAGLGGYAGSGALAASHAPSVSAALFGAFLNNFYERSEPLPSEKHNIKMSASLVAYQRATYLTV